MYIVCTCIIAYIVYNDIYCVKCVLLSGMIIIGTQQCPLGIHVHCTHVLSMVGVCTCTVASSELSIIGN